MATLIVDRISKSFGKIQALKDVSFECKDGEFVVIVGPSGAGKTTTLNCIAGVEYPDRGTVYLDGKDVTMLPPQQRNVSMVFETYALYPQLSVYENLAFPLRSPRFRQPEDEIQRRVLKTAQMLGIDMLLDRLPRQLSQGQRQRVSLGRALVREPLIFLLDEPISHLDAKLRNAMRRELKRMRSDLTQTTVYVTHDYLEALSLADRVVVLYQGQVLQFDETKTVYNGPAAVEVGRLFGDLPMMFFDGQIDEQGRFVEENKQFTLSTEGSPSTVVPSVDVILGVRPADVQLVAPEQGNLVGEVYSVQNQFDQQIVTVAAYGYLIDAIVPVETRVSEGDRVGVYLRPEVCFYFDRQTHRAL